MFFFSSSFFSSKKSYFFCAEMENSQIILFLNSLYLYLWVVLYFFCLYFRFLLVHFHNVFFFFVMLQRREWKDENANENNLNVIATTNMVQGWWNDNNCLSVDHKNSKLVLCVVRASITLQQPLCFKAHNRSRAVFEKRRFGIFFIRRNSRRLARENTRRLLVICTSIHKFA